MSKAFQNFLFANKIEPIFYKASLRRSLVDVPHTHITILQQIGITSRKLNKVHILPINKKTAMGLLKNKEIVNVEVVKVDEDVIMNEIKKINPDFSLEKIPQTNIEPTEDLLDLNAENRFISPEAAEYINQTVREYVEGEFKLARKIEPGFSVVKH